MSILKPKFTRRNEIWCRILKIQGLSKNVRKTQDRKSLIANRWFDVGPTPEAQQALHMQHWLLLRIALFTRLIDYKLTGLWPVSRVLGTWSRFWYIQGSVSITTPRGIPAELGKHRSFFELCRKAPRSCEWGPCLPATHFYGFRDWLQFVIFAFLCNVHYIIKNFTYKINSVQCDHTHCDV